MSVEEQLRSLVRTHHTHFIAQVAAVDRLLRERDGEGFCGHANVVEAQASPIR